MKRVGFFGGTFDPIHFGHLNLAIQLMEKHRLDEVLFCVTARSPLKKSPSASGFHRMMMTKLAIRAICPFRVCTLELERPGVSYTVDTLRTLRAEYDQKKENVHLFLLLAEDALDHFDRWKNPEEILHLASPLVGMRSGERHPPKRTSLLIHRLIQGMTLTEKLDISSTQIRRRLKKGLYCGHLVPARVLEYIRKNSLY